MSEIQKASQVQTPTILKLQSHAAANDPNVYDHIPGSDQRSGNDQRHQAKESRDPGVSAALGTKVATGNYPPLFLRALKEALRKFPSENEIPLAGYLAGKINVNEYLIEAASVELLSRMIRKESCNCNGSTSETKKNIGGHY